MRQSLRAFLFLLLIALPAAGAGAKAAVPAAKEGSVPAPAVASAAYIVIDRKSGKVIAEKEADAQRPIASLTKMMTGLVVLEKKVPLGRVQAITADDKVGGSALNTKNGTKFTVSDLFYASFLASANDATNALADATRLTRKKFVAAMNAKAKTLKLTRTVFADPTGIDDRNISTPREMAKLFETATKQYVIRRAMTTAKRTLTIRSSGKKVTVKNANGMLWKPEFDDIWVSGGKTGYCGANGGWNLAVSFTDAADRTKPELILVLFGAATLKQSEDGAETLARWAWENFTWK